MIETNRQWVIAGWVTVVAGIAALLNSPLIFPTPPPWVRILVPLIVLVGAAAEFHHKARYGMWVSIIGAWLFALDVFFETVIGDREAYIAVGQFPPHSLSHSVNFLVQLAFVVVVLSWVYWRKKRIRRMDKPEAVPNR